jgi:integrase
MSRRTRYQQGSVQREKRRSGPDVWIFRWYETGVDGKNKYRKAIVGTVASYTSDDDYVFASESMRGKQPYWPDNLIKRHIRPVAKANGIHKNIGWHTFRHSFGTLLKANGEDVKTVQELLRHANSRITLDVYTQAVNSTKRAAQSKVVRMIVSDVGQTVEEKYPHTRQ